MASDIHGGRETQRAVSTHLPVSVTRLRSSYLTLQIKEHLRLDIPSDFDPDTLKRVIQILQTS
ncbi:MAG: hypothetical protein ABW185_09785 [Sedimenticola sp.]